MKTPPIYQWKRDCERRIEEIKEELRDVESQPDSPLRQKKIDRLERNLTPNTRLWKIIKGVFKFMKANFNKKEIKK